MSTTEHHSELRALFRFSVTQSYFDLTATDSAEVNRVITETFDKLGERFGLTVLGTIDDDETVVGNTADWLAYILVTAPDRAAVVSVCDLLRQTTIGQYRLWRYIAVEARIGRPLFFGSR